MPISRSGGAVRIDKSACIPFGTNYGNVSLTTSYMTLQSITGKGFLDLIILNGNLNTNSLRITIDGVVTFEGSSNNSNFFLGITKRDLLLPVATSATATTPAVISPISPNTTISLAGGVAHVAYPYTANTLQANTIAMVADSIYFHSSLLIEVKSGAVHADFYNMFGGYQP